MRKEKEIEKNSILGIALNVFLAIIKLITGFFSHSQSMIADAFNSVSDVLSSIFTFIGNRISAIPKDEDHNLGHGKAEYIYSMFISILMLLLIYKVAFSSIRSLFHPEEYHFSIFLIFVSFITIFVKLFLFFQTYRLSKKYDNLLVRANAFDHRNDILLTTLNLIAIVLSYFHIRYVDGIVGLLICAWIFFGAIRIFIESYHVLMDRACSVSTKEKVYEIIQKRSDIKKITHFNSTPVGYRYQISFSIFLDGNMSTFDSHQIADSLEKEILKEIDEVYLCVIHVNPYMSDKR